MELRGGGGGGGLSPSNAHLLLHFLGKQTSWFRSTRLKCRFYEDDGRVFTLSAYQTGVRGGQFVRFQNTFLIERDDLEFGDGIDMPASEWHQLTQAWPCIMFCWRFNMSRKFNIVDRVNTTLSVEVTKCTGLAVMSAAAKKPKGTGITIYRRQMIDTGYLLEGSVHIDGFTAATFEKTFERITAALHEMTSHDSVTSK